MLMYNVPTCTEKGELAMLTRDQVNWYFERGYTVVEGAVEGSMLDRARSIIDRLVANIVGGELQQ